MTCRINHPCAIRIKSLQPKPLAIYDDSIGVISSINFLPPLIIPNFMFVRIAVGAVINPLSKGPIAASIQPPSYTLVRFAKIDAVSGWSVAVQSNIEHIMALEIMAFHDRFSIIAPCHPDRLFGLRLKKSD